MITVKRRKDCELNPDELRGIINIYKETFLYDKDLNPQQVDNMLRGHSQFNTFEYYWVEDPDSTTPIPKIVATGNFIRNYHWAHLFSLNTRIGENVGSIATLPEHRHQGYATAIVKAIIEDHSLSTPLILEIEAEDPNYECLYQWYMSLGFTERINDSDNPHTYLKYLPNTN